MAAVLPPTDSRPDGSAVRHSGRDRGTKHRLVVLTSEAADTISSAGGLLFDRAAAGWQVDVYVPTAVDDRAFRILGVSAPALQRDIDWTSQPDCVVIAGSLYERDRTTQRFFRKAARADGTEATLWGGRWPRELGPGIGIVEHHLSLAALAFKSEAMRVVGLNSPCTPTETFYSGPHRLEIAAPLLAPA